VLNVICISIFWQLIVKPTQLELSELLQAIAEECREIMEMDRKRATLYRLVNLYTPLRKKQIEKLYS